MILDANNAILGRLATEAAKLALRGNDVNIVNCEKALMSGKHQGNIKRIVQKRSMGQPSQGPFIKTRPNMFVRRTVRGMLPFKNDRGREALLRVKCYIGTPERLEGHDVIQVEHAKARPVSGYMTIGSLCRAVRER